MSEWVEVTSKVTGRRVWARVSKASYHSDDSYFSWREPEEYEVVTGKVVGFAVEPELDSYRQTYSASEFYQLFSLKEQS